MGDAATQYHDLELRYDVNPELLPANLAALAYPLGLDDDARAYIDRAVAERSGWVKTLAQRGLRNYVSDFDANGLLGMYPMHLLSTAQARRLLGLEPEATLGQLLDVGAGNGDVTANLAPLFDRVTVSELSWAMARRLAAQGYECHRLDVSHETVPGGPFDVVSVLNVMDRCSHPRSLLRAVRELVGGDGRLLLSVPLPYLPHAYDGPSTHDPIEPLALTAEDWHAAVAELVELLQSLQFQVERISRLPYLSGGDAKAPIYVLDAALIVATTGAPS